MSPLEPHYTVISIITPSCNQGLFLAATIESVISQEGDFSIDYIIVDGCSCDNSVDIIKHYEALLQRSEWPVKCLGITFRWLSERDNGQTDALIKGFRMAHGEIFAWLNSDDTYLPGALQAAAGFLQDHPGTGLLYGDANYCDTTGVVIGKYGAEPFELVKLASANIICQPATFFRRTVFEAVGGLNEALDFVMDYDLWIRIGRRYPCQYMPKMLATYRLHETSKTINTDTLIRNSEESLDVTIRHFGWAPLNRVYTSCRIRCEARLPALFSECSFLLVIAAIVCSIFRSLSLNRGLHRNDLRLLTWENFCKLSKNRIEIMTGNKL